jgi:hypothetical protein
MQDRDALQVLIAGQNPVAVLARQPDQLIVDIALVRHIDISEMHLNIDIPLEAVENFKATPATAALARLRRVRYQLQLANNELWYKQISHQEPGLGKLYDPAIDDRAGIEQHNLAWRSVSLLGLKFGRSRNHVEQVGFHRHERHDR